MVADTLKQSGGEGGLIVRRVPIAALHQDPANVNKHPDANLRHISDSLKTFGQVEPLVVQKGTGKVIGGNGRLQVLAGQGVTEVDVVELDIDDTKAAALGIALNRSAKSSEFDDAALAAVLATLPTELQLGAGFDDSDLRELDATLDKPLVDDEPPAPLPDPVSRRGDIWEMGGHRLMCGDSTDGGDVALCLNGSKPFLMVTDPPYGVEYDGGEVNEKKRETLAGDTNADMYEAAFANCPSDVAYAWFAGSKALPVYTASIQNGFVPRVLLIWNKLNAHYAAPSAHYKQRHEPCLYSVRKGRSAKWCGDMTMPTVWDIDQPSKNEYHPTQKPIECMARPIRNHDAAEVYEPFSGSGTTIIACEQLGRKCYAIEIEPRYVDVGIRRWQKLTGKSATLDGKPWAEVAAERGVKVDV